MAVVKDIVPFSVTHPSMWGCEVVDKRKEREHEDPSHDEVCCPKLCKLQLGVHLTYGLTVGGGDGRRCRKYHQREDYHKCQDANRHSIEDKVTSNPANERSAPADCSEAPTLTQTHTITLCSAPAAGSIGFWMIYKSLAAGRILPDLSRIRREELLALV